MTRETIEWRGRVLPLVKGYATTWKGRDASVWEMFSGGYHAELRGHQTYEVHGYGKTPGKALEAARTELLKAAKGFE